MLIHEVKNPSYSSFWNIEEQNKYLDLNELGLINKKNRQYRNCDFEDKYKLKHKLL